MQTLQFGAKIEVTLFLVLLEIAETLAYTL
jgi:hypothetical protein